MEGLTKAESIAIDLSEWTGDENLDLEHILLSTVPKSSHLQIKSAQFINEKVHMEYYDHLLQVTNNQFAIIYDLDKLEAKKVNTRWDKFMRYFRVTQDGSKGKEPYFLKNME